MRWTDSVARRIKLRDLQVLLAVANSGSMGRAAVDLAVSQPAISKAITDLEHELGVRLFDRSPQGVVPTIYGDAILKSATAIFDDLRQGVKAIEFLGDPTAGELRIGTSPPLSASFVPTVIESLAQEHQRFTFEIVQAELAALHRELRDRRIDLAIAPTTGLPPQDDMNAEVLFFDQHVAMAGVQCKWTQRRKIAWSDVVNERWVLAPPQSVVLEYLVQAFHAAGIKPPNINVATLSIPLHFHLLGTGGYLAFLPVSTLCFGAKGHSLKALRLASPVKPSPVAVLTLKNRTLSPAAKTFIDLAHTIAKKARGELPIGTD